MGDFPHSRQWHASLGGTAVMAVTVAAVTKGTDSSSQGDSAVAAEITTASNLPAGGDGRPGGDISVDGVTTVHSLTPPCLHVPSYSGSPQSRMDMTLWISSITALSRVNHSLIKFVIIFA